LLEGIFSGDQLGSRFAIDMYITICVFQNIGERYAGTSRETSAPTTIGDLQDSCKSKTPRDSARTAGRREERERVVSGDRTQTGDCLATLGHYASPKDGGGETRGNHRAIQNRGQTYQQSLRYHARSPDPSSKRRFETRSTGGRIKPLVGDKKRYANFEGRRETE
jgi:hypothetical protein